MSRTRPVGAALACLLSISTMHNSAFAQGTAIGPNVTIQETAVAASPAAPVTAARVTADWFATVDHGQRKRLRAELQRAAGAGDDTARFGLGAVQFFDGLERFGQSLNRHGLMAPRGLALVGFMPQPPAMPTDGEVVPLDHATFRSILVRLHADMDEAAATLASVDRQATVSIPVDLGRAKLRMRGEPDGTSLLTMARTMQMLGSPAPSPGQAAPITGDELTFAFDTADAVWLQGYANVVMAQLDFALAHDFERLFDETFQVFFPHAGLEVGERLRELDTASSNPLGEPSFFDAIALLHLIDLPVIEPDRRVKARERLLEVVRLSRENWRLIEAEKDADREWLPGPQQQGAHPLGADVTAAQVAAWRASLDLFEVVLEGKMLMPHPRFGARGDAAPTHGVNVKRFFESKDRFDLVLFLTGQGALPFMEKGEVASRSQWQAAQGAFGQRDFLTTALWFN